MIISLYNVTNITYTLSINKFLIRAVFKLIYFLVFIHKLSVVKFTFLFATLSVTILILTNLLSSLAIDYLVITYIYSEISILKPLLRSIQKLILIGQVPITIRPRITDSLVGHYTNQI